MGPISLNGGSGVSLNVAPSAPRPDAIVAKRGAQPSPLKVGVRVILSVDVEAIRVTTTHQAVSVAEQAAEGEDYDEVGGHRGPLRPDFPPTASQKAFGGFIDAGPGPSAGAVEPA